MPFDETTYKPAVFSLEGLRDWLREQDPETGYDYTSCSKYCLLGRYFAAHDIEWTGGLVEYGGHDLKGSGLHLAAQGIQDQYRPDRWTYGRALARCEALLAEKADE